MRPISLALEVCIWKQPKPPSLEGSSLRLSIAFLSSLLKNAVDCHPERSEGAAFRKSARKKQIPRRFAPRNDILVKFFNKLLELLQPGHSKNRVKSFAVNRHRLILMQIGCRWQIIVLVALIHFQHSK